jgi:hypothetical protein
VDAGGLGAAGGGASTIEWLRAAARASAHDLNDVWTVILGFAGHLSRTLDGANGSLGDERRAALSRDVVEIRLAAERGREITRRLRTAADGVDAQPPG